MLQDRRAHRPFSVVALVFALGFGLLPGRADASPPAGPSAAESDDPALVRDSDRWFRRAERLATRAKAMRLPKRLTRAQLDHYLEARSNAHRTAEEAYEKAGMVGYRANREQWSGLSPRFMTRVQFRYAELALDFYLAQREALLAWQEAHPQKRTACYIPEGCNGESFGESTWYLARETLKACVNFSTIQRHWDETSEACEVLLAQRFRSESRRRLDELRPVPHWTALPYPRDPVRLGSEGEPVRRCSSTSNRLSPAVLAAQD